MLADIAKLDVLLRGWVVAHRLRWIDPVMLALSIVGRGGMVWIAIGLVLTAVGRLRRNGLLQLVVAIAFAALITDQVLKPAFHRERPFSKVTTVALLGNPPRDASFPSGHSANAFAAATVLSRVVPGGRIAWWCLAIAIAYSRVYLGVHYPGDVVGGAVVGWLCAAAAMRLAGRRASSAVTV